MLLLVVAGCQPKDPNEVEVETYTLCDSVFIESEYSEGYSRFNVSLDLPVTKNKTLKKNILHWMLSDETEDHVGYLQSMRDDFFEEDGSEPRSEYEENYTLSEQTDKYVTGIAAYYWMGLSDGADRSVPKWSMVKAKNVILEPYK